MPREHRRPRVGAYNAVVHVGRQEESGKRKRTVREKNVKESTRLAPRDEQRSHDEHTCSTAISSARPASRYPTRRALLLFALVNVIVSVNATLTTSDCLYPARRHDRTGATLAAKSATMRSQWRGNVRSEIVSERIGSENLENSDPSLLPRNLPLTAPVKIKKLFKPWRKIEMLETVNIYLRLNTDFYLIFHL